MVQRNMLKSHLLLAVAFIQVVTVFSEDKITATKSQGTSLSLEQIALLSDAAEKLQKKPDSQDEEPVSNFQHRLKQVIQTARVAAGSGQSTGSPILDQTIKEVRDRINSSGNGSSVPDTSIFDEALKAFGSNKNTPLPREQVPHLVDTIVKKLVPSSPTETTTPASGTSLVGDVLSHIAKRSNSGGSTDSLLDVVVKQLVPTTTTTTTPRPAGAVLDVLAGLVKKYQGNNQPDGNSGGGAQANANQGNPTQSLLNGFQDIIKNFQAQPSAQGTNASSGGQPLEQLLGRLGSLIPPQGASKDPSQSNDFLKWIQSAIGKKPSEATTVRPASGQDEVSLEGFEGLIPEGGKQAPVKEPMTTQQPTATTDSSKKFDVNNAGKLLAGLFKQITDATKPQQG